MMFRANDAGRSSTSRFEARGLLIGLVFFLVTAPTLGWVQFANGIENLVVTTALEMRRTGNWLYPTLQGEPRYIKPPLATWIAAASIRQSTFAALSSADAQERAGGYRALGWQVRWPSLLAACVALALVVELGRIVGGVRMGLLAGVALGTMYLFARGSRAASTDVQLFLWVSVAHVMLAMALFEGRRWVGCIGAGAALGLAFMSKGPVALVQTLLPLAVFVALGRRVWRGRPFAGNWNGPIAAGALAGVLVGLPWFVLVAMRHNVWARWLGEVARTERTIEPDSVLAYFSLFAVVMPWTVFFSLGLVLAAARMWEARRGIGARDEIPRVWLVALLLVVPLLVMTCFPDRKDRYLLPLMGPAAVLIAHGLLAWASRGDVVLDRLRGVLETIHWVIVGAIGVVAPLLAATGWIKGMTSPAGAPWLGWGAAIPVAAGCALVIAVGLMVQSRRPMALPVVTALVMLVMSVVGAHGYSLSEVPASRDLADLLWARFGDAPMYSYRPGRRVPEELSIYVNREVRPIPELSVVKPAGRWQIVMVHQRTSEAMPPLPTGWQVVGRFVRGRDVWHAAAVPPAP